MRWASDGLSGPRRGTLAARAFPWCISSSSGGWVVGRGVISVVIVMHCIRWECPRFEALIVTDGTVRAWRCGVRLPSATNRFSLA